MISSLPWRTVDPRLSRAAIQEVLFELSEPGCIFCRAEGHEPRRYYFWYLAELYFEPPSIAQMVRSVGFCRRHTQHLLARGAPPVICSVYDWMLHPFIERLRSAETLDFSAAGRDVLVKALLPQGACAACANEAQSLRHRISRLRHAFHEPEVRRRLEGGSGVCLRHFLSAAPLLEWEHLRSLLDTVLGQLPAAPEGAHPDDATVRSPLAVLKGQDLEAGLRSQTKLWEEIGEIVGTADPTLEQPLSDSSWSPSLERLHRTLALPACPMCYAGYVGLRAYFAWLGKEVCHAHPRQWEEAIWLCRTHSWDFASSASATAVTTVQEAMGGYWRSQLENFAAALDDRPASHLLRRLATVPGRLQQVRSAAPGSPWTALGSQLATAWRLALESPHHRLARICGRWLRERECPACHHLHTIRARTAELLVRGLADPGTLEHYQQSRGVCLRCLPLAMSFCRDASELGVLARTERVRLEVLRWEVEEFRWKESWSVRFAPKAGEQSVWRRIASQVSGGCVGDGTLIGLD